MFFVSPLTPKSASVPLSLTSLSFITFIYFIFNSFFLHPFSVMAFTVPLTNSPFQSFTCLLLSYVAFSFHLFPSPPKDILTFIPLSIHFTFSFPFFCSFLSLFLTHPFPSIPRLIFNQFASPLFSSPKRLSLFLLILLFPLFPLISFLFISRMPNLCHQYLAPFPSFFPLFLPFISNTAIYLIFITFSLPLSLPAFNLYLTSTTEIVTGLEILDSSERPVKAGAALGPFTEGHHLRLTCRARHGEYKKGRHDRRKERKGYNGLV